MLDTRRRLPHLIPDHVPVFVTWRLAGTWPRTRNPAPSNGTSPGQRFAAEDNELDQATLGPRWLSDPQIASMIVEALQYGVVKGMYTLDAFVVMPNHVHAVWQPLVPMPQIMQWVKGTTARRANRMLGIRGQAFWQEESYDHWIRSSAELVKIVRYVEFNPVKAGLASSIERWRWSSAFEELL